ncbi:MAG: 16S rRNA (uracil(1498)-N(3))-methyltransferase [Betaproteobacteria bacterium]|nr:16S rRNA (uracil(1498)-N(3))-methyltransferase [Betaproteobacteria bacterium]
MQAPRFHVALALGPEAVGRDLPLPDAAAHHAVRVLRLAAGQPLVLFDGRGGECTATLAQVDKRGATVRVERYDAVERESALAITLLQAVIANDMMDYAVRKATELGVTAVQPVLTARSAPLPAGERGERRRLHWQQVAVAACEQCGRNRVPAVAAAAPLAAVLAGRTGRGLILAPGAAQSLAARPSPDGPVALLVGPEGGFAPQEIAAAQAAGWEAVGLGLRVLRAETAGVAAIAAMQVLWGDFR